MSRPDRVRSSEHLDLDSWPARGAPGMAWPEEDARDVWERARRLNVAHAPHGHARVPDHDEARYDEETQTVIFRRQDTLTTCYSVREEAVTNDHGRAVREAVEAQFGPVEDSSSTTSRYTQSES